MLAEPELERLHVIELRMDIRIELRPESAIRVQQESRVIGRDQLVRRRKRTGGGCRDDVVQARSGLDRGEMVRGHERLDAVGRAIGDRNCPGSLLMIAKRVGADGGDGRTGCLPLPDTPWP